MKPSRSRRDFLRTATAVAGVGATAGLAGCLDDIFGLGSDTDASAIRTIEQWTPARDEVDYGPNGGKEGTLTPYQVKYMAPATVAEVAEKTDRSADSAIRNGFELEFDRFDVEYADVSWGIRFSFLTEVIEWPHETDTLTSTLRSEGFEPQDRQGEFRVMTGGLVGSNDQGLKLTYAFDGTHLLRSNWSEMNVSRSRIPTALDARNGRIERLVEEDDTAGAMAERATTGDVVSLQRFDPIDPSFASAFEVLFEGQVGACFGGRFDGDRYDVHHVLAFEDSTALDRDALTETVAALEADEDRDAEDVSLETDGRIAVLTYDVGLDDFFRSG
jgi:hypothetical protein